MTASTLGVCRFLLAANGGTFEGVGEVWIGNQQVRSGRLPMLPMAHSFSSGLALARLELLAIDHGSDTLRIRTRAWGAPLPEMPYSDYHLARVFSTTDWDRVELREMGELDLVFSPAEDHYGVHSFRGFAYHYEYRSVHTPLYFLRDRASWELDGDIMGATVYNQSVCGDPCVTFGPVTEWTTEERITAPKSTDNPVITHAFPRWAGHQAFDHQFKGDATLLGIYERLGLIRSVLRREAGQPELKTFDTHEFNEALTVASPAKRILLNADPKTLTAQRNLWTDVLDEVSRRARTEASLHEVPQMPFVSVNYWSNFTYATYRKDLLPALAATGVSLACIDNVNRNGMTEMVFSGNQCQSHEYEPAARLGGTEGLRSLVTDARRAGVRLFSWSSTAQGPASPILRQHRRDKGWFVRMPDSRTIFGDTHSTEFFLLNLAHEAPRAYWVESLKRIKADTGLDAYYLDMLWNVSFAALNYENMTPRTQWKESLEAFRSLQESGIDLQAEVSAFGQSRCGYHPAYQAWENLFLSHKLVFSAAGQKDLWSADDFYRVLAHQSSPALALFYGEKRIDQVWTEAHREALTTYIVCLPQMYTRILQEDGLGILWLDKAGASALLWNFATRTVTIPGRVTDLTSGRALPVSSSYELHPRHTYGVEPAEKRGNGQVIVKNIHHHE